MTKSSSWKTFSLWLPGMMFMVAFVLLGYAIYDWQTSPSAKVLSKIAFEPFPEFVEGAKETITIRFENTTNKRLRVVGMETC
ncbi:MAG: hypothetical protein ABL888_20845 [Pirellulaceae bacterium]